jgi:restriction endonuclease Mrr
MNQAERVKIGSEFECIVAQLYSKMGYDAETKKKIIGRSGVEYEVDIYLERGKKKAIVECKYKYYGGVSLGEVALFLLKMDDVDIKDGFFVTNSFMTEPASLAAKHYGISCTDGEQLELLLRKHDLESKFRKIYRNPIEDAVRSVVDLADEAGILKAVFRPN